MVYVETRPRWHLSQDEPTHLERYLNEFITRYNIRTMDTIDQMRAIEIGMDCKRLRYRNLIADNGLDSEARE